MESEALKVTEFTTLLIGDDAGGIRICNFTGKLMTTLIIPRYCVVEAKQLPDLPARGVYYLLSMKNGKPNRLYAGQTTQGISRLDKHVNGKQWWDKAIMFLAPDAMFPKDIVDGLEALMIRHARQYGFCDVDNSNELRPRISPYKKGHVNELFEQILWRMDVLGYRFSNTSGTLSDEDDGSEEKGARNPPFNFTEFGISKGAIIEYYDAKRDLAHPEINAKVESPQRIRFRGQVTTISIAAKRVVKSKGSLKGMEYWTYNGRRLIDIYREKYPLLND